MITGSTADGCDPAACDANATLTRAVTRYTPILSPTRAPPPGSTEAVVGQITVCVTNAAEVLGPEMNETHALAVPAVSGQPIRIDAASQHGALRSIIGILGALSPGFHVF